MALCAALLLFDPNGYKQEIETAVQKATGRALALHGPMRVEFGVPPVLVAEDVAFANPAGASRPQMATLERAEARIAVLPLLSGKVVITGLTLVRPDVWLERDVAGRGNWLLATDKRRSTETPGSPERQPATTPQHATGRPPTRLRVAVQSIHIENGRIDWVPNPGASTLEVAIPHLDAVASAPGGTMLLDGTLVGDGRTFAVSGKIGAPGPAFDQIEVQGESSLGPTKLAVDAAPLADLLPGSHPTRAVPIDITLDAGRASISAKGTVADPAALKGVDADVSLRVPDLAAFGPLIGRRLPTLSQVALDGHVFGDVGAGGSIGVRHATLTLPQARLSGDADIRLGARPYVHATLTSERIDVDALRAALSGPWSGGDKTVQAPPATPGARPAAASPWVIPDQPIDFGLLDRMDAELRIHVDAIRVGGAEYTQVGGTARLRDGKLEVDPLAGLMPGGPAEIRFSIDTRAPEVPMALSLRAPSLQLAPLLSAFGVASFARGSVRTIADIQAAGRTPHAIAASLDGKLGIASIDAEIDNRLLLGLLRLAKLPDVPLGSGGMTRLRCFAVRLDASKGDVAIGALVADTQRLVLLGGGSFDLGREQLALQVRPMLRLGGGAGRVVVPVHVGGGFRDPQVAMEPSGKGEPAITGSSAPDPCVPALAAAQAPTGAAPEPAAAAALEAAPPKPEKARGASVLDVLKNVIK